MFVFEYPRKIKSFSMNETPDTTRSNVLGLALIVPDSKRRRALALAMAGSRATIVRESGEYPSAGGADNSGHSTVMWWWWIWTTIPTGPSV